MRLSNLSSASYLKDTFGGVFWVRAISSWAGLTSTPTTLAKCGAKSIVPWPEPQPTSTASPDRSVVYLRSEFPQVCLQSGKLRSTDSTFQERQMAVAAT